MEFTVEERLATLSLLPPEGNLITMKVVHELRQGLAFSEEDLELLQFEQSDGQLRWKNGVGPKHVPVGHQASVVIYDALKKLDEDSTLKESHLALCEKFEYAG